VMVRGLVTGKCLARVDATEASNNTSAGVSAESVCNRAAEMSTAAPCHAGPGSAGFDVSGMPPTQKPTTVSPW
jgi:hypothetical protein